MRFKEFILEGKSRSTAIESKEKLIEMLRTHCMQAMKEETPYIVRGVESYTKYKLQQPSKSSRVSANTSNEYTTWMDNNPTWQNYPKRSQSLICTTIGNFDYTLDYGEVHLVIPFDNAKIAVCSAYDLWYSFPLIHKEIGYSASADTMNDQIRSLLNNAMELKYPDSGDESDAAVDKLLPRKNTSYESLLKAFDVITDFLRLKTTNKVLKNSYPTVSSGKQTFAEFMTDLLDPKKNDFKLVPYKSLKSLADEHHEVWTTSDCVLIRLEHETLAGANHEYSQIRKEVLDD